jgi:hypothetical protein
MDLNIKELQKITDTSKLIAMQEAIENIKQNVDLEKIKEHIYREAKKGNNYLNVGISLLKWASSRDAKAAEIYFRNNLKGLYVSAKIDSMRIVVLLQW